MSKVLPIVLVIAASLLSIRDSHADVHESMKREHEDFQLQHKKMAEAHTEMKVWRDRLDAVLKKLFAALRNE